MAGHHQNVHGEVGTSPSSLPKAQRPKSERKVTPASPTKIMQRQKQIEMLSLCETPLKGELSTDGYDPTCGMMPDEDWRKLRWSFSTQADLQETIDCIAESPEVVFSMALGMEIVAMQAEWTYEAYRPARHTNGSGKDRSAQMADLVKKTAENLAKPRPQGFTRKADAPEIKGPLDVENREQMKQLAEVIRDCIFNWNNRPLDSKGHIPLADGFYLYRNGPWVNLNHPSVIGGVCVAFKPQHGQWETFERISEITDFIKRVHRENPESIKNKSIRNFPDSPQPKARESSAPQTLLLPASIAVGK